MGARSIHKWIKHRGEWFKQAADLELTRRNGCPVLVGATHVGTVGAERPVGHSWLWVEAWHIGGVREERPADHGWLLVPCNFYLILFPTRHQILLNPPPLPWHEMLAIIVMNEVMQKITTIIESAGSQQSDNLTVSLIPCYPVLLVLLVLLHYWKI